MKTEYSLSKLDKKVSKYIFFPGIFIQYQILNNKDTYRVRYMYIYPPLIFALKMTLKKPKYYYSVLEVRFCMLFYREIIIRYYRALNKMNLTWKMTFKIRWKWLLFSIVIATCHTKMLQSESKLFQGTSCPLWKSILKQVSGPWKQ